MCCMINTEIAIVEILEGGSHFRMQQLQVFRVVKEGAQISCQHLHFKSKSDKNGIKRNGTQKGGDYKEG